jgi:hypothetical protein
MLMVQISVPSLFENERQVETFLVESLREAIELAKPVFKTTKIPYLQDEYLKLVESIENSHG